MSSMLAVSFYKAVRGWKHQDVSSAELYDDFADKGLWLPVYLLIESFAVHHRKIHELLFFLIFHYNEQSKRR